LLFEPTCLRWIKDDRVLHHRQGRGSNRSAS
jgi:hypothetical protein